LTWWVWRSGVQTNIRALGDVASTGTNAAPLFRLFGYVDQRRTVPHQ
jgi:hypothetical protein